MQLSFQRGVLILSSNAPPRLMPNLDIASKVNASFEEQLANTPAAQTNSIANAHRNFLRDVPYQFFIVDRVAEGEQWLKYLRQKSPDDVSTNSTLAEYALARATFSAQELSHPKAVGLIRALVIQSYRAAIRNDPDEFNAYMVKAKQLRESYVERTRSSPQRLEMPSLGEFQTIVRDYLLSPQSNLSPDERLRLRSFLLQMSTETPAAASNAGK